MMKRFPVLSLILALAYAGSLCAAEQIKSGPQVGDSLGAFNVTKCAGAVDDGVDIGKNLCYRCRNGERPQVVVFTRSTDPKVIELIQKLDTAIVEHEGEKLRSFVNLLGEDQDALTKTAEKLAAISKTSNVPFVVPNEFENGPDNYGINAKAAVTVVLASELGVKANFAVADAKDLDVDAVIKDIGKIVE
ncbi:MAG: hypothetical protein AB7U20_06480 [Planctomycetaceae bacterium]